MGGYKFFCIITLVHINIIDEIILGIGQYEKIHSILVGFIFVVHSYITVPDSHGNLSLIKITMIPKIIVIFDLSLNMRIK